MRYYITEKGGFSNGESAPKGGLLSIHFGGLPVDGVIVGGHMYPIRDKVATIDSERHAGTVAVIARNGVTKQTYPCDSLDFTDDKIVPLMRFTPAQYVELVDGLDKRVKELEETVERLVEATYGIKCFEERKEEEK